MENSKIEWCDHTFNPWWGCVKVSPGCSLCYAEKESNRKKLKIWGKDTERRLLSDNYWKLPLKWNKEAGREGVRKRVFCASMADVFEDNPMVVESRERLWEIVANTPNLDWLLLTKRPENMLRLSPWGLDWPSNIWAITSVENQKYADTRIPELLKVPAIVRGLSIEPMVGPVDLTQYIHQLQFVIVGGESAQGRYKARRMHPDWVRSVRDQCQTAGVAFFYKQAGNWSLDGVWHKDKHFEGYDLLDGVRWHQFPKIYIRNRSDVG